jgi:HEAT repeat protein
MKLLASIPWGQDVRGLRARYVEVLDDWAEVIKDAILDAGAPADAEEPDEALACLPVIPREAFVQALRGRVEEALSRVAGAVDEATTGEAVTACERQTGEDFHDLGREAFATAVRLRIEAIRSALAALPSDRGQWALKYRRMCALEPLLAALKGENNFLRYQAAQALGGLGDGSVVEGLAAALGDPDPLVRRASAEALGRIGDRRAAQFLRASLYDEDPVVCKAAGAALKKIYKKDSASAGRKPLMTRRNPDDVQES